jgi:hypothetical protein
MDLGATNHITGELDRLIMHEPYTGRIRLTQPMAQVWTLLKLAPQLFPPPIVILFLTMFFILLLIMTHSLSFTLSSFLLRTAKQRMCYCKGCVRAASIPFHYLHPSFGSLCFMPLKSLLIGVSRLGHPSREIVHRVVSHNNLPCANFDMSNTSVCDACACAKAHQLSYQLSSSTSFAPLQLIFSDVWGHAIESFGCKRYYVSFIDDYSKFTWIYLLRRLRFTITFLNFRPLLSVCLIEK